MSKKKTALPNFSGKCLSISIINDTHNYDIYDPTFETQGGRLFITGKVPKGATDSNWAMNSQIFVAWDRVSDYYVFKNLKAYKKAIKTSEKYQKKN